MMFARTLSFLSLAVSLVAGATSSSAAQGTDPDPVPYELVSPPSQFEWGCFGPCACPVLIQSPLAGGFVLRRSHVDPLYTWYDVLDVRWKVPGTEGRTVSITGTGTYRRGGEVALQEELTLDLSFDGDVPRHFTSGLQSPGASFPRISTRVTLHEHFCFDSSLVVSAQPVNAGVGDGSRTTVLALSPNPFAGVTDVAFVLPQDGVVELGVFDLAGRRVSTIVARQWLASGPYHRAWDGLKTDRAAAAPGVYLVRLDTAAGRTVRTLVKR